MPRNQAATAAAVAKQVAASTDPTSPLMLVAGPGSGKSQTIEGKVVDLLNTVPPDAIFVISFTNASVRDLRDRIVAAGVKASANVDPVTVSTLHSLAARSLRRAHLLYTYPVEPLVLDRWEVRNLVDSEFMEVQRIGRTRATAIREYREAIISTSTGTTPPANYIGPTPAVSAAEQAAFETFVNQRRTLYACVLPGELVRECLVHMQAGSLDPVTLLGIKNLIVDEFQDLNPVDVAFVDALHTSGVDLFISGDDDQSIYSFRYGSPEGMQSFPTKYPNGVVHTLDDCFRCTPEVLAAAQSLISAYAMPNRLQKVHSSLYAGVTPPQPGVVHRWRFAGSKAEADAIAASCTALISAGVAAKDILILLSNQRNQARVLYDALDAAQVPYIPARTDPFIDSDAGRVIYATVRSICNPDDLVARWTLLGFVPGVGVGTLVAIGNAALTAGVSTPQLFAHPQPGLALTARQRRAVDAVRTYLTAITGVASSDTLATADPVVVAALTALGRSAEAAEWSTLLAGLPGQMLVEELLDYLRSDNPDQQASVVARVYERLQLPPSAAALVPDKVQVMSMHGSKGLSASVVFIPGLEDELIPGRPNQRVPVTSTSRRGCYT